MLVQSYSGIRGVYGKTLTEDVARRYAYCFYKFVKARTKKQKFVKAAIMAAFGIADELFKVRMEQEHLD